MTERNEMKKVNIRVSSTGKIYNLEATSQEGKALNLKPNQSVLVDVDQIIEEGRITESSETETEEGSGTILRELNAEDFKRKTELKKAARDYIEEAQQKANHFSLGMKILDADLSFDQKKLTFYFSANGRIDFRLLVSDMAKSFNKLIRLQQVGSRDEAKYFGGIGKCGREYCCSKFLTNPENVTLEMAEAQNFSSTSTGKITGCCGKLMCCLSYESGNYPPCGKAKDCPKKQMEAKK